MTSVPSATTWGSPTAAKQALLIHGMTLSSHTWHHVASALAAQGYFVTAPNLVGHGSRTATDYRLSAITEDLRSYFEGRNYSLIMGHSLGALVALALSTLLPPDCPTAVILVDPPLQIPPEMIPFHETFLSESCVNTKHADAYSAENPLWEREDCISRELGARLCTAETVHIIFEQNQPWNFVDYFTATPKQWKVTTLMADPTICMLCPAEVLRPYPHVRAVTVSGAGHCIHYEFPEIVVKEALKTVAELEIA